MQEAFRLLADRFHKARVIVPQGVHRDPRAKVEIFLSLGSIKPCSFPVHKGKGKSAIDRQKKR
jgi:hypothetical protein